MHSNYAIREANSDLIELKAAKDEIKRILGLMEARSNLREDARNRFTCIELMEELIDDQYSDSIREARDIVESESPEPRELSEREIEMQRGIV